MSILQPIQIIFVPRGQEHQAVCRGVSTQLSGKKGVPTQSPVPVVVPVPVGMEPLRQFLQTWECPPSTAPLSMLLMGLCGSLTDKFHVGQVVVYGSCVDSRGKHQLCDPPLTKQLCQVLKLEHPPVAGFSSDRLIHQAAEKRKLAQQFATEVVDMEGYSALEGLVPKGIAVGMIRVVSDDCQQDLPDLSAAFSPDGALQPLPLAIGMLRQPWAAAHLIQGSLKGLKALEQVSQQLVSL
jgi:nucleoside phosphorylase